jgi:hypothetical protein
MESREKLYNLPQNVEEAKDHSVPGSWNVGELLEQDGKAESCLQNHPLEEQLESIAHRTRLDTRKVIESFLVIILK